ncbi:MAG: HEAT repeat domain-containing protein [Planctomycetota bacterium]
MSRVSRHLGLVLALAVFAAPQRAVAQDDVKELFDQARGLLERGEKQDALRAFQRVLAADPSHEQAFELFMSTEREVVLQLLVEGGDFELVAKRFLERARAGQRELQRDESAIAEAVAAFFAADDAVERRTALNTIRANHGEYAVPALSAPLGDESAGDERVFAMAALSQLGSGAVLPLIEALTSDNAFMRRNAATVLGMTGDPRAGAMLLHLASTDSDLLVQAEALKAAGKCGASGRTAVDLFLLHGDLYHRRDMSVLRDIDYSDVVWSMEGGELVSKDVPRSIYNNELAKRAYYRALAARPDSLDALAGIARESVDIHAKLEALAAAGEDVEALLAQAGEGSLAVAAAGTDALDRALTWSVQSDDTATGGRIARVIAQVAARPTSGLQAALRSGSAGLAGEAAVALAHIAAAGNAGVDAEVVAALGEAAGREVVRIAFVVDGDLDRASAVVKALTDRGVLAQHIASGALGVATISQLPGVDVVLVGDRLPDITSDAVIKALQENGSFGATPIFFMSADEELASAYGDRVAGSITDVADLSALDEVFDANLEGDRAQADELSANAAGALAAIARGGRSDLGGALASLAAASGRRDGVAIPAMHALGQAGGAAQAGALLAVATDGDRSDEARIAAADAIGAIAARAPLGGDVADALRGMLNGDASLAVRTAAARAVGRLGLGASDRAGIVESVRVSVSAE